MREKKFRVMFRGSWCTIDINLGMTEFGYSAYMSCVEKGETLYEFTGLTDKNGVEIYEGDIYIDHNYDNPEPKEVSYSIGEEGSGHLVSGFFLWYNDSVNTIEIIGNIHENPELLK